MANAFSRSWEITKLSFNVMKQDKELLLFPILGGFFSIAFVAAMIIPSLLPGIIEEAGLGGLSNTLAYLIMFLIYLGLSFIATFFNVCVVFTTKTRFEGGNATFGQALGFAVSRIHLIFAWSLLSATVGLILRVLDNIAARMGQVGRILMAILTSVLGMVWSIITIFVVPVMVYQGVGPFAAIRNSVQTLKKTWGESLIRHFALGLIQFAITFIGILLIIVLIVLTSGNIYVLIALVCFGVLYVIGVSLVFGVANSIFNTALYVYASTGAIPSGFSQEVMQQAFQSKKPSLFGGSSQQAPQQQQQPAQPQQFHQ